MPSKFDPMSWKETFDSLSTDAKDLLCLLAIYAVPTGNLLLKQACESLHTDSDVQTSSLSTNSPSAWSFDKLKKIVKQLEQSGWVEVDVSGAPLCKNSLREQILYYLANTGQYQRFANVLAACHGGFSWEKDWTGGSWYCLLNNKVPRSIDEQSFRAIWNLFIPRGGVNWLNEGNFESRCQLLGYLLVCVLFSGQKCDFDVLWNILIETGCDSKCDPATQVLILDYVLCAGKIDDLPLLKFPGLALTLCAAHRAFVSGNYPKAVEQYRLALKSFDIGNRNKVLPFLSGIFHALAELSAENSAENYAYVQTLAEYGPKTGCWQQIQTMAQRLLGLSPHQIPQAANTDWLSLLLSAYESVWFQLELVPGTEHALKRTLRQATIGLPWIAAEITDVCESLGTDQAFIRPHLTTAAEFRKRTETKSLLGLFPIKANWERCLERLQFLANEISENPKQNAVTNKEQTQVHLTKKVKARLIWLVNDEGGRLTFTPREQKWLKSGKWQKRPTEIWRMSTFEPDYLMQQDKLLNGKRSPLDFVGHPLLFSKPCARTEDLVPIELANARPKFSIQEKDDQLHVSFEPSLTKCHQGDDSDKTVFTIKASPTRYNVIKLTEPERQIRKLFGVDGLMFPKKAKDQLSMLLRQLAETMIVDTGNIEITDDQIPADLKIHIRLSPHDDGIQAEFVVHPLGPGGPHYHPGFGLERPLDNVEGKSVQTVRNFTEEKRLRDAVIAAFPAFQKGIAKTENLYIFNSLLDSLSLLSELKTLKEGTPEFVLYWPDDRKKYAITSKASVHNLNISLAPAEDWLASTGFVVTGMLEIGGEAIELQDLLARLKNNPEDRFIELTPQKFLALTKEFRERLGEFKKLVHPKGKTILIHPYAANNLKDFFDEIPSLQKDAYWIDVKKRIAALNDYKAPVPSELKGELFDYQREGYEWLTQHAEWGTGCCLADDMGVGKTIQAIAVLLNRADDGPALVVAPTSVCFNWENEAKKFAPALKIKRLHSGLSKEERHNLIAFANKWDVLLMSYTLLQREIDLLTKKKYATVILDEAQAIKTSTSRRAKAACRLQAGFRLAMTGTPVENNLMELWSLFHFLNPGLLGSPKAFKEHFVVNVSESANDTLRRHVHPFIKRRNLSDVWKECPPLTRRILKIKLSQNELELYEEERRKALDDLDENNGQDSDPKRFQILSAINRLRQLCCNPKMVWPDIPIESSKLKVFRKIMGKLAANRHKVLVFSQFVKHLEILKEELIKMKISFQYLDGSTKEEDRKERVGAFQSGESDAFLISIKAGGSGLNLPRANFVIHVDPWWNPAVEDQATARAHRRGQTQPVTEYRLITRGTIEETIVRLHRKKRNLADKLLESTDQATSLTVEELTEILRFSPLLEFGHDGEGNVLS